MTFVCYAGEMNCTFRVMTVPVPETVQCFKIFHINKVQEPIFPPFFIFCLAFPFILCFTIWAVFTFWTCWFRRRRWWFWWTWVWRFTALCPWWNWRKLGRLIIRFTTSLEMWSRNLNLEIEKKKNFKNVKFEHTGSRIIITFWCTDCRNDSCRYFSVQNTKLIAAILASE